MENLDDLFGNIAIDIETVCDIYKDDIVYRSIIRLQECIRFHLTSKPNWIRTFYRDGLRQKI